MKQITYKQTGDLLLPNLAVPEQNEYPLGRYAQMRRAYLQEHRKGLYTNLKMTFTLHKHLYEIEQTAIRQLNCIVEMLANQSGITEQSKAADPMQWTQQMNSFRRQAEEQILSELIYS